MKKSKHIPKTPFFSIIIPVFNEEKYLEKFTSDLIKKLKREKIIYELILSENGSTDKTLFLCNKLSNKKSNVVVISDKDPNYGSAVKRGFLKASGKYLVLFDLDYYDVKFLKRATPLLEKFDAVIGAKRGQGAKDSRPLIRRLVTFLFSLILRLTFSYKLSDTHGLKVLNRQKFLKVIKKCRFERDIFDTELLIRGNMRGLSLTQIGVKVKEQRASRSSIVSRIPRTIRDLFYLKLSLINGN